MVGIVGPSGSGKSTLTKLIQRLYVPERGRVLVDGVDIAMIDVAWLRRQVGVVLQENVLFNRSIRDNIALADPSLPFERVIAAAQLAGAHDFILELPAGYDTVVGERGATLSGGQRQRIAIARADRRPAHPHLRRGDQRARLRERARDPGEHAAHRAGRTVIVVAHRLSTVARADRIVTIEAGRIVEDGTHDQLIRGGGRYATLHRMQAGLHEVV
jgi:subfamily B ATP-binding cassette protein HlyB/CyaB